MRAQKPKPYVGACDLEKQKLERQGQHHCGQHFQFSSRFSACRALPRTRPAKAGIYSGFQLKNFPNGAAQAIGDCPTRNVEWCGSELEWSLRGDFSEQAWLDFRASCTFDARNKPGHLVRNTHHRTCRTPRPIRPPETPGCIGISLRDHLSRQRTLGIGL